MRWPWVWRRDYEEAMDLIARQFRGVAALEADLMRLQARVARIGEPAGAPGPVTPLRATPLSVREADEAAMRRLRGEAAHG